MPCQFTKKKKLCKYHESYLQLVFSVTDTSEPRPQCVICIDVLANDSMKPLQIKVTLGQQALYRQTHWSSVIPLIIKGPLQLTTQQCPVSVSRQKSCLEKCRNSLVSWRVMAGWSTFLRTSSLATFWVALMREYPPLSGEALKLLPFTLTYSCETGFSKLTALKTKYRGAQIENDLAVFIQNWEFSSFAEKSRLTFNIELKLSINAGYVGIMTIIIIIIIIEVNNRHPSTVEQFWGPRFAKVWEPLV